MYTKYYQIQTCIYEIVYAQVQGYMYNVHAMLFLSCLPSLLSQCRSFPAGALKPEEEGGGAHYPIQNYLKGQTFPGLYIRSNWPAIYKYALHPQYQRFAMARHYSFRCIWLVCVCVGGGGVRVCVCRSVCMFIPYVFKVDREWLGQSSRGPGNQYF